MQKTLTRQLTSIGVIIALMSMGATVKFQMSLVPISLQSFFPLLVGSVFDKKTAIGSQLGYLILGLIGLPIFAHGGGIGYVLRPTFGYLLALPLAAYWIASFISRIQFQPSPCRLIMINFTGCMIILFIGALWMYILANLLLGERIAAKEVIIFGVLVFLPGEIVKSIAVSLIAPKIKKYFNSWRIER